MAVWEHDKFDNLQFAASPRERRAAGALVASLCVTSIATACTSHVIFPMAPAFIPAFAGMILISDALASALLFNLYRAHGRRLPLAGAAAYLVNAMLIVPWAFMFPGVVSAPGRVGTEQTSPWLLLAWHFTFPVIIAIGVLTAGKPAAPSSRLKAAACVIGAVAALAMLLILVSTRHGYLPAVVRGPLFLPDWPVFTSIAAVVNLIVCAFVIRERPLSGMQLWLAVALFAAALDMGLNAVSPARFSLTWYAGKLQTIVSAGSVLVALLAMWSSMRTRAIVLSEQLSLFNLVVEATPSAMVLVNERGAIAFVNARTEQLFGYPRAELLERSVEVLVPKRFRAEHPALRRTFGERPVAREMGMGRDLYGRRKDGTEIPIEIGLNPIVAGGREFTLAAISDITERKAIEELRLFKAHAELLAVQLEVNRERQWSTAFQRAVLPAGLPQVAGCRFDAMYEPGLSYGKVGGDWFDVIHLIDGRIVIAIGDVCGSGLEAAVVVGVVRQVMRGIAQLHVDSNVILDAADRALRLEYPDIFVSAWIGVIDLVNRTITYASAGHPAPFVISADGTVRELTDPTTLLIGLRVDHGGHASMAELGQGDTIVLFTDGLIEANHDIIAGLEALRTAAVHTALEAQRNPAEAIRRRVIPKGCSDDTAILVVRTDCSEAEQLMERWRFDASDGHEAAIVRKRLVESLNEHGFAPADCANAELAFGELIGNVVRHAGSARRVDVVLDHGPPHSVLHVMDRGAGFNHTARLPRDPYAESGRGLYLIAALTIDFTVSERAGGGSHARAVLRGRKRGPASCAGRPRTTPVAVHEDAGVRSR